MFVPVPGALSASYMDVDMTSGVSVNTGRNREKERVGCAAFTYPLFLDSLSTAYTCVAYPCTLGDCGSCVASLSLYRRNGVAARLSETPIAAPTLLPARFDLRLGFIDAPASTCFCPKLQNARCPPERINSSILCGVELSVDPAILYAFQKKKK